MMVKSDGGHFGEPSAGMRSNAAPVPEDVRSALLFVAEAGRRASAAMR